MSTTKNFTTTLPLQILKELDDASKDLNIAKNDVLVDAFLKWNNARKQELVARSYRDAAKDTEWKNLAEEGIADWARQIKRWEK